MTKAQGRRPSLGILGLLLPSILFVCPCAFALDPALDVSQYAHTAWRVREGFIRSGIMAIAQTPDGYLWLGTEFGLYRFDGVRATPWQPPDGEQLPSTYVVSLLTSRDGTLWIGTRNGLASWKDGKSTKYSKLVGHTIISLLEDHEGTIWVGAFEEQPDGMLCAIRNGAAECHEGLGYGVLSLYEDSKGDLWVGNLDGFWHWKPGPPKFYPLGPRKNAQAFAEDADGALLIAVPGIGLYRFDGRSQQEQYALPNSRERGTFYRMLRDRDGALWIAVYGGGLLHVTEDRTDAFAVSDGLSGDAINALFQDREGNIWVATLDGLDRFRNFAIPTWSVRQGFPFAPGSAVLAASDGSIWTGSSKGMARLNQGQITIYRQKRGAPLTSREVREIIHPELPETFVAFLQDHRGRIWVSSLRGHLGYVEDQQYHPIPIGRVATKPLVSLAENCSGDLWIAEQGGGLFRIHEGEIAEKVSWADLGRKAGEICDRLVTDDSGAGLWIAHRSGGITYFKDGHVRAAYSASDGLGEGVVNDLRFDSTGSLWAATQSGLSLSKDGRFLRLTSKNGLPCDTVHWSIEDDDHFFWLYTACGLLRITRSELDAWASDPKNKVHPTTFDASDGARTEALPTGASPQVSKAPDGKIWFVSFDGIRVIDPRHLPYNKLPPPVHIEQITADRKSYDGASYANGKVPLPARIRDLQIDYTALSLVAPEKIRFRYKLEGRDRDWQEAGNRRQAFYTDLPPRNYRFRVKACNNSGVWNEAGAFLDFSVAPAYYQTMWFRLSCVAAFLALLAGLYRLRLRQLAWEFNMRLDERVSERTRIARELHDSLLQGVQGLMFRLQAMREMLPGRAPAEAIEALDVALERGDKVIVEGRDTISDLRQSAVGDSDIALALTALGEELAAQSNNGAAPCVRVLVEGKQRELNPMLRDEIYRIAREALRNAFRHSKAQKIEAQITYGDSEFLLHVRDDGIGIASEVTNRGARAGHWGLPGMRERAKSFGGKLEVWSEQGAGTEIELTVPAAVSYGKSNARHKS